MKNDLLEKYGNIRFAGFCLFILASIFCLYKIYDLQGKPSDAYYKPTYTTSLKLLNVIGRHGDRSPSDEFPKGDRHAEKVRFFWPNGLSNLTEIGKMRQFRIGLELRRRYRDFLSYNSSHYLAFSSPIYRCQESVNHTLRGLFDIEWTSEMGRRLVDQYNSERVCIQGASGNSTAKSLCDKQNKSLSGRSSSHHHHRNLSLPSGSGSPAEFKNVAIDVTTLPVLTWEYLEACKYRKAHPSSVDQNLMSSRDIANLKGSKQLAELIKKNYHLKFDFQALPLWATIDEELRLARTRDSIVYGEHYFGWVNERPPEYKSSSKVTFLDLYEQLVVIGYRDRLAGQAKLIQLGPIISSLVQSQKRALVLPPSTNQTSSNLSESDQSTIAMGVRPPQHQHENSTNQIDVSTLAQAKAFNSPELYKDKKAIFYSTHDTIFHSLMDTLNMTYIDTGDFEWRFNKWHRSDDVDKLLAGFKMPEFGASLILELYEVEKRQKNQPTKRLAYLKAALYNEEDGKYKQVEYRKLKLGSMCRHKFEKIYSVSGGQTADGNVKRLLNGQFYDEDEFPILDKDYDCPFELFTNITSEFMMGPKELTDLCSK